MKRYFETACMPLRATTLGFRNHPFLDIFLEKIHFHDSFYCKHSCNSNPSSRQYFLSAHDMLTLCVKHFITTHRSQGFRLIQESIHVCNISSFYLEIGVYPLIVRWRIGRSHPIFVNILCPDRFLIMWVGLHHSVPSPLQGDFYKQYYC